MSALIVVPPPDELGSRAPMFANPVPPGIVPGKPADLQAVPPPAVEFRLKSVPTEVYGSAESVTSLKLPPTPFLCAVVLL